MIARGFVVVSENKNQAEADYRYVFTRLRENGESIAMLGGETEERAGLDQAFATVRKRWRELMMQYIRTTVVSQASNGLAPIIPILLCAPKYVAGTMTLGEVMQAASAFMIVQVAFNWLVENYPRLADWTASACRLASLLVSLDRLERAESEETTGRIVRQTGRGWSAPVARPLGHLGRRKRRGERSRYRDYSRREGAGRRRIRHGQEHAGAGDRRPVAVGYRRDPESNSKDCF